MSFNPLDQTELRQEYRLNDALKPDYFNVEELSFEQLVVYANKLAEIIVFYDTNNQHCGNWGKLFSGVDVVVLAHIKEFKGHQVKQAFNQSLKHQISDAYGAVYDVYQTLDFWIQQLQTTQNDSCAELYIKLNSAINKKLLTKYHAMKQVAALLNIDKPFHQLGHFEAISLIAEGEDAVSIDVKELTHELSACLNSALNVIVFAQATIEQRIANAFESSNHDPAIGLLLAFLKLYQVSQQKVNQFTQAHLAFYYRQLLKFESQTPVPQRAFIRLHPAKKLGKNLWVDAGTKVACGNSSKQANLFEFDKPTLLSNMQVSQVCSLGLRRDPLISPENDLDYVTQIAKQYLDTDSEKEDKASASIATFGINQTVQFDHVEHGEVGLAISSSALALKEGLREITLTVLLADPFKIAEHNLALFCQSDGRSEAIDYLSLIFADLLDAEPHFLALVEQSVCAVHAHLSHEQRLRFCAEYLTGQLCVCQIDELMQVTTDLAALVIHKHFLIVLLAITQQEHAFSRVLGRIFSRQTLLVQHRAAALNGSWLSEKDLSLINKKASQLPQSANLTRLLRLLSQSQVRTFYELYDNMFDLSLSTAGGWHGIDRYAITPIFDKLSASVQADYGFCFKFELKPEVAAISACQSQVHGEKWSTQQPTLKLQIKPVAAFFPYSIFRSVLLSAVYIDVNVNGLADIVAHNSFGRLDPTKSFAPFGAVPKVNSYLVLGSLEMANKQVLGASVNIEWADLPIGSDGFKRYYFGYPTDYSNKLFTVASEALLDGCWVPTKAKSEHCLFAQSPIDQGLLANSTMSINLSGCYRPISGNNLDNYDYTLQSRNSFFRFKLLTPETGFGHQQYAQVLPEILLANAKAKRPKTLPNPAYTPMINRLTLNYRAQAQVIMDPHSPQQSPQERIDYIHPFGYETIYPLVKGASPRYLFPRYGYDGNLFIGLSASELAEEVNLYFQFDEKAKIRPIDNLGGLCWFYLVNNQWRPLHNSLIKEDTTSGFVTSGGITLALPREMSFDNSVMPTGQYWLRIATNHRMSDYGRCLAVYTHGAPVTRLDNQNQSAKDLMQGKWLPFSAIAGLEKITPISVRSNGTEGEGNSGFVQRVSERLSHKGRAITSRDYERIILQEFADIDAVKCIPHTRLDSAEPAPGHVLVLVRKQQHPCEHQPCHNQDVSSDQLVQIEQFIRPLCADFIKVTLANPNYESVQVRCAIKFKDNLRQSMALAHINQALSDFLCPWGQHNQGYGWQLKVEDIKAYLRQFDAIEYIQELSLLHIVETHQQHLPFYELMTSVSSLSGGSHEVEISPSQDWCLLRPYHQHVVVAIDSGAVAPMQTGVGQYEVGGNFVIGDASEEVSPVKGRNR